MFHAHYGQNVSYLFNVRVQVTLTGKTYFDIVKQGLPVSLLVAFPNGQQIDFASGNENPDYCFIVETKVLKDTEKEEK